MHDALCEFGQSGLPASPADWIASQGAAWTLKLTGTGLPAPDVEYCLAQAGRQLAGVLEDEVGRWILEQRPDAVSEYGVSGIVDGAVRSFRFDRAFKDEGVRWVVDFKTGPVGGGAQSLEQLVARHRPQLDIYRSLAADLWNEPVRTALYLTALPRLVEVRP